ncbi:23S rRNA (uracil(1939)-C(5))-methyltransferase RlmD [Legionella impletisoli]|uniref:23S rRNA (uracil(1939)-C(5))-methyltransferase RlmD n=2 Tax=Bacteria TaxID=2 RepID=A0A917JL56_9GAMM|nr:23S rRNA (uracil(1939)-C(5))-methyltransferase RlmD [Legionella impletisoli]GGI75400.1 23S rRNA (uracil(1939)-C(5))-methyltransferase RlmD [Legionella impletisoli]
MSKRRNRLPNIPFTATIERFSHDGRGIARIDGKATFIEGALPGEQVRFQYLRQKKDFDEGRVIEILAPSLERVVPQCPHYGVCGGCSLQHLDAKAQIYHKQEQLLDLLARTGHLKPEQVLEPLTNEHWHYRKKARLSARFVEKKHTTLVGFREKSNPRYIADISSCNVLSAKIDAELLNLRTLIDGFSNPSSIAQIELAEGDEDTALIFRNLGSLTEEDEKKLAAFGARTGFKLYLQPGGEDTVSLFYPKDSDEFLSYQLPDEAITFKFHPTDFTQVNSNLNRLMVNKALQLLALEPTDYVLDLFCGLGNFSLPMAKHCQEVLGVEGSERMVQRARMNARLNQLSNAQFLAANLEDERTFAIFADFKFNKVLLDPPRTGALAIVKHIHRINPSRIVYVSCNPATLARDADILFHVHGYTLKSAGVMDMFPHTAHVESIAVFDKT